MAEGKKRDSRAEYGIHEFFRAGSITSESLSEKVKSLGVFLFNLDVHFFHSLHSYQGP